jgi:hypothetical protein
MLVDFLSQLLGDLPGRNRDNVSRTESYLELYSYTVAHPPDLPWLLMAHLVSRNAGYLMTGTAIEMDNPRRIFKREALRDLFLFLERANFLIFHDAFFHVLHHLLGRTNALCAGRTPAFIRAAWQRYEAGPIGPGEPPAPDGRERRLVLDLVENEQNYIEHRVVHHPRFAMPRGILSLIEMSGMEKPMFLPGSPARIKVGGFGHLDRRITAGRRLFDEALFDRAERRRLHQWAIAHPHTGSPGDHGGRPGPTLRDAWPLGRVLHEDPAIHDPPEDDPRWP